MDIDALMALEILEALAKQGPVLLKYSEEYDAYYIGFPDHPSQEYRVYGETLEEVIVEAADCLESLTE